MSGATARLLAIAFGPRTMAEAMAGLPQIRQQADCVELRLDLFEEPFDLAVLLRERGDLPVVVTLRPPHEGGKSTLPPNERLEVLLRAADLGAEYVDLEWDAASPEAMSALRSAGARVVVSRHDFSAMPPIWPTAGGQRWRRSARTWSRWLARPPTSAIACPYFAP